MKDNITSEKKPWHFTEEEVIEERAIAREKFLSDQATRMELAIEKGKAEGKAELRNETIQVMHSDGLSAEQIAKYLSITVEEVHSAIHAL